MGERGEDGVHAGVDVPVPDGVQVDWLADGLVCRLGGPGDPPSMSLIGVIGAIGGSCAALFGCMLLSNWLGSWFATAVPALSVLGAIFGAVAWFPAFMFLVIGFGKASRRVVGPTPTQIDLSPVRLTVRCSHLTGQNLDIAMSDIRVAQAVWPPRPGRVVLAMRDDSSVEIVIAGSDDAQLDWVAARINELATGEKPEDSSAVAHLKSLIAEAQ